MSRELFSRLEINSLQKLYFVGGLQYDALCENIVLSKGDNMIKTVKISLEQVRKDAESKGMEVIEHSAFPFQYLEGLVFKQGEIIIHAWALSENETRLDRQA